MEMKIQALMEDNNKNLYNGKSYIEIYNFFLYS